jgi:hypothetical protein
MRPYRFATVASLALVASTLAQAELAENREKLIKSIDAYAPRIWRSRLV